MKRLMGGVVFVAIGALVASAALAQAPPRSQTKELQNNAPAWVKSAMANWVSGGGPTQGGVTITGMTKGPKGWEGDQAYSATNKQEVDVWHRFQLRPYDREVFNVKFEKPERYSATVVFEDYGKEITSVMRQPGFEPVLVKSVIPPDKPTWEWEYE